MFEGSKFSSARTRRPRPLSRSQGLSREPFCRSPRSQAQPGAPTPRGLLGAGSRDAQRRTPASQPPGEAAGRPRNVAWNSGSRRRSSGGWPRWRCSLAQSSSTRRGLSSSALCGTSSGRACCQHGRSAADSSAWLSAARGRRAARVLPQSSSPPARAQPSERAAPPAGAGHFPALTFTPTAAGASLQGWCSSCQSRAARSSSSRWAPSSLARSSSTFCVC